MQRNTTSSDRIFVWACITTFGLGLIGCERTNQQPVPSAQTLSESGFSVMSTAFQADQPIPPQFTADGKDISPPLSWPGIVSGTREVAITVEDPDAPKPPWIHWVIYKIPPGTGGIPQGVARDGNLSEPQGAMQGKNSWGEIGYHGPDPARGAQHRYIFRVYALDAPLDVKPGLDYQELMQSMSGHVLSHGETLGIYQR